MPLRDGEYEERDAAAEQCAGNDVGEPVDLQVGATPRRADDTEAGERPPPSAARAGFREEQDERDTGRAGIGGMAGGEGGADRVNDAMGRAGAIDQGLEKRGEQRRHALGDCKRDEGERATSAKEEQSDERERNGSSEPAPEPVEDEREVSECRCLDVMHRLGPAAVEVEWSCRYEDRDQNDEREQSSGCPKRMSWMREKRFS
ncbi:MAG TPA: hypothetical protein VF025_06350 [Gaiellaceae bacterium]